MEYNESYWIIDCYLTSSELFFPSYTHNLQGYKQ